MITRKSKPAKYLGPLANTMQTAKQRLAAERRRYRIEARAFVAESVARGERCPVVAAIPELRNGRKYGHPISARLTECHHRFGRVGKLLRWQAGWMAVSRLGHRWIHQHVSEARAHGWMAPVGQFNNQKMAS